MVWDIVHVLYWQCSSVTWFRSQMSKIYFWKWTIRLAPILLIKFVYEYSVNIQYMCAVSAIFIWLLLPLRNLIYVLFFFFLLWGKSVFPFFDAHKFDFLFHSLTYAFFYLALSNIFYVRRCTKKRIFIFHSEYLCFSKREFLECGE